MNECVYDESCNFLIDAAKKKNRGGSTDNFADFVSGLSIVKNDFWLILLVVFMEARRE